MEVLLIGIVVALMVQILQLLSVDASLAVTAPQLRRERDLHHLVAASLVAHLSLKKVLANILTRDAVLRDNLNSKSNLMDQVCLMSSQTLIQICRQLISIILISHLSVI